MTAKTVTEAKAAVHWARQKAKGHTWETGKDLFIAIEAAKAKLAIAERDARGK